MSKLKPCPFCGGAASVSRYYLEPNTFVAGCRHTCAADPEMCGVMPRTLPAVSKAAAIKSWNARGDGAPKLTYWQGEPEIDLCAPLQGVASELWRLSIKAENPDLAGFLNDASSVIGRIAGSFAKPRPRRQKQGVP